MFSVVCQGIAYTYTTAAIKITKAFTNQSIVVFVVLQP
ncbi:hypothetical protein M23134_00161 [Microscilla marina ATCC 23134]|uniref:Uncharacterized protein n=1 Tax=Microscilla marina ATCC 23134 TaxID=313606 RepID=A1ZL41_MICM2|nr:hypothetical protein M23134_00161 [Microscilla marina ATCC 23134]